MRTPTVLVADDEILVRDMASQHLREAGYGVIEASNAAEAIEALNSGEPVDLVFTDIAMPGSMDGVMLMRWLAECLPHVRVVLATGGDINPPAGARLFRKPYDLHEVEAHIRDLLG